MKYHFDTNSLIYLSRSGLAKDFFALVDGEFCIDDHVYNEAVIRGEEKYKSDVREIHAILESCEIPIITVDIADVVNLFYDAGESSCYLLSLREGITITSDLRAIKRLKQYKVQVIQLPDIYYALFSEGTITQDYYFQVLEKLEHVHAISPTIRNFYQKKIQEDD